MVVRLLRKKKRTSVKRTGDMGYGMAMAADLLSHGNDIERNMDAIEEYRNSRNQQTNLNIPEQAIFRSL